MWIAPHSVSTVVAQTLAAAEGNGSTGVHAVLLQAGVDSVVAHRLTSVLQAKSGAQLPATLFSDNPSLAHVARAFALHAREATSNVPTANDSSTLSTAFLAHATAREERVHDARGTVEAFVPPHRRRVVCAYETGKRRASGRHIGSLSYALITKDDILNAVPRLFCDASHAFALAPDQQPVCAIDNICANTRQPDLWASALHSLLAFTHDLVQRRRAPFVVLLHRISSKPLLLRLVPHSKIGRVGSAARGTRELVSIHLSKQALQGLAIRAVKSAHMQQRGAEGLADRIIRLAGASPAEAKSPGSLHDAVSTCLSSWLPQALDRPDEGFMQLGAESRQLQNISARLADALSCILPATLMFDYASARRLSAYIATQIPTTTSRFAPPQSTPRYSFDSLSTKNHLNLPMLPIPSLGDTLRRLVESCRAVTSSGGDCDDLERDAEVFLDGTGKKLQAILESDDHTNFMQRHWNETYLRSRACHPVHVSPFFKLKDAPGQSAPLRCADFVLAFVRWSRKVVAGQLVADLGPRCVSAMGTLFNAAKVPKPEMDAFSQDIDARHIIILANGNIFKLDVIDDSGKLLVDAQTLAELLEDTAASAPSEDSVCVLTSANRDVWARERSRLMAIDRNPPVIRGIEHAIVVVAVDSSPCKSTSNEAAALLMGDVTSRWFDKQQIVLLHSVQSQSVIAAELLDAPSPPPPSPPPPAVRADTFFFDFAGFEEI